METKPHINEQNHDLTFRHELKYLCTQAQLALIESRIALLMRPDPHAGGDGQYEIRSLYFDNVQNTGFFENEDGVDRRAKYRIRIYDHSPQVIHLELKEKQQGKTRKHSCELTEAECRLLMQGIPPASNAAQPPLLKQLCLLMQTQGMAPRVIVEYERTPFIEPLGNVRVTFDRHIRSSGDPAAFLDARIPARPIMPVGQHILEVKFDAFLPDAIARQLQMEELRLVSFSKYYLCRKYHLGGARI